MASSPEPFDPSDRFAEACQRAGVRLTPQRLEVFRVVATSTEHPDAESVYRSVRRRVPNISLDTVYRTLWLLAEQGFLKTLGPRRESVRFDANLKPHHHFQCVACGRVVDLHGPLIDESTIAGSVASVGTVRSTHLEVRGLCASCQSSEHEKASVHQEP